MNAYKVLRTDGRAHHGGHGAWPLPNGKPGEWLEVKGALVPCERGLHLCRKPDLIHWLGPAIFLAEYEGERIVHENKIVVARARLIERLDTWNETTARLFAADCADYAVRRCRKAGLDVDPRVSECIRVAYRYARGEASKAELAAARSAARSGTAWSAARSAARSAAWSAARSAARSGTAWSAAGSAAGSAAWSWQTKRLFEYLDGKRG